jgi:predicted choloylglycine hydrolase
LVGDEHRAHSQPLPPAPEIAGCSRRGSGSDGPLLIRSFDFPLDVVPIASRRPHGRGEVTLACGPGGCLDGMNVDGLVASMTFGGSRAQGPGFSIILMLRYVLETCRCIEEAIVALSRIPIAMAHNVTLLDRSGAHATLYLGPDRAPGVTADPLCTNHQEQVVWPEHATRSLTVERRAALATLLAEPGLTPERLIAGILAPPLYSRRSAFPTVYTAVYRPQAGRVDYLWPGTI